LEAALVDAMGRQTAVLLQMWEIVVQQREALKSGRLPVLQDLMRSLQGISAQARTEEASRDREARRLAAALGCDPCVSALAEALGDGGGGAPSGSGRGPYPGGEATPGGDPTPFPPGGRKSGPSAAPPGGIPALGGVDDGDPPEHGLPRI